MVLWQQHLLVGLLVAACATLVGVQAVRTLRGKKSKLGSCCAKGCDPEPNPNPKPASPQVHFLPVEMLRNSRPRR